MSHDGSKGGEGVHGDLRSGARYAPQQGGLAGVRVTHKAHVGDGSQLESVVPALPTLAGNFLGAIDVMQVYVANTSHKGVGVWGGNPLGRMAHRKTGAALVVVPED